MEEFIPLGRAAALAHERLFPGRATKESKALDLLALALSALLPLYQRDMDSGTLHRLDETAIAEGRFTRAGTTLEYANRPPLRFLVVPRRELAAALDKLAEDALLAASLGSLIRPGRGRTRATAPTAPRR